MDFSYQEFGGQWLLAVVQQLTNVGSMSVILLAFSFMAPRWLLQLQASHLHLGQEERKSGVSRHIYQSLSGKQKLIQNPAPSPPSADIQPLHISQNFHIITSFCKESWKSESLTFPAPMVETRREKVIRNGGRGQTICLSATRRLIDQFPFTILKIKEVLVGDRKNFLTLQSVTEADSDASIPEDLQVEKYSVLRILEDLDIQLPKAWTGWFCQVYDYWIHYFKALHFLGLETL